MIFWPLLIITVPLHYHLVQGFPIIQHDPHLVVVPPSVVLQHNQTQVEVNCSAFSQHGGQPASLQWILLAVFQPEDNESDQMGEEVPGTTVNTTLSEVVGPTDINSCIYADVTSLEYNDQVSQLNLFIEVSSEECIDEIAQGSLYVRGLCVASSAKGATSETFVLGVVASDFEEVHDMFSAKKRWRGTPAQRERYHRNLLWMLGLMLGLAVPVATGVFVVFNLTCMRNPVGGIQGANMFSTGNVDMWSTGYY